MIARILRQTVFCFSFAVPAASAQTPVPTPVPPLQTEEPIEPDRPDVTNGTHIVDVGLLQLEFGGIYSSVAPGLRAFGSPFTARVGLFEWLEARVGMDGLLIQQGDAPATGFGNVNVGAKLRLWADPGGVPVLSILPTVNIPTASAQKGLGSGSPDYTLVLLTGTDFLTRGHVDFNWGIGAMGAGNGQPHFKQQLGSVSASMSAGEHWDPYFEAFWYSTTVPDGGAMTAIDAGAIYTLNPRLAFDGGFQVGLSGGAPWLSVFAGVSMVVGDVLGDHGVHARQRRAQERAGRAHK